MFDKCQLAINSVLAWKDDVPAIDRCECSTMATFQFAKPYDVILMRWICGYLKKQKLIQQLATWKTWLKKESVVRTRT